MKISGIYQILNLVNGHCYIGSSNNIKKRWITHKRQLKINKHHSIYLQRAWNKYGSESFKLIILQETNELELFHFEEIWHTKLKPEYCLGSIGGGDNISKHPNLEEIKQKHRDNLKLRFENMSDDEYQSWTTRRGKDNPNWRGGTSKPLCPICKTNHMAPQANNCLDCRDKCGNKNPFFGKHHSESTKQKLRQNRLGIKPKNSQKVRIEGIIYASKAEAAKALGVSNGLISYRFKQNYPNYEIIQ